MVLQIPEPPVCMLHGICSCDACSYGTKRKRQGKYNFPNTCWKTQKAKTGGLNRRLDKLGFPSAAGVAEPHVADTFVHHADSSAVVMSQGYILSTTLGDLQHTYYVVHSS